MFWAITTAGRNAKAQKNTNLFTRCIAVSLFECCLRTLGNPSSPQTYKEIFARRWNSYSLQLCFWPCNPLVFNNSLIGTGGATTQGRRSGAHRGAFGRIQRPEIRFESASLLFRPIALVRADRFPPAAECKRSPRHSIASRHIPPESCAPSRQT